MTFRPTLSPAAGMFLVTLFWGGNFTATKVAFADLPPLAFTALRFALATLVLWIIHRQVEGRRPLPPGRTRLLTRMEKTSGSPAFVVR